MTYPPEITVSNGLFTVALGDPSHRNAGSILNFADIFRNYSNVYLALVVGTDPEMTPRIKVISSAYALNAEHLSGKSAGEFLDTSSTAQTKSAQLTLDASSAVSGYGVEGRGPDSGGYFMDSNNTGYAYIGYEDYGLQAFGNFAGGYFKDLDQSGQAYVGYGDIGISAYGSETGGFFKDADHSGHAYVGIVDWGIYALGNNIGGYFKDLDHSGYAWVGYGDNGIYALGNTTGGYFKDLDHSGYAWVGYGDYGIYALGNGMGGYFKDADSSSYANVGYGNRGISAYGSDTGGYFTALGYSGVALAGYGDVGIYAYGNNQGGYFEDNDNSGYAYVGYGDRGIYALGNTTGGYFKDADSSGYAYVGYGDYGIEAQGNSRGGYFRDIDQSGYAYVGYGDNGISSWGNITGGYFKDADSSGYVYVGFGDYGIYAFGNTTGGYFKDLDDSGYAYVGYVDRGIYAWGDYEGGEFRDSDSSGWAGVGYSTYKISGSGTVSFVQNHPYNKEQVIVYAAPEGDEVATYTRGAARLINGEARIQLGGTFKWVTNPDIGLTAYLTPRGEPVPLAVESLTTSELVVRGPADAPDDLIFDYIVYGLRIGFEESSIVQEKQRESYIPSMNDHRQRYEQHPELRQYNALERFKGMRHLAGLGESVDLSASQALRDAVQEYDPAIHGKIEPERSGDEIQQQDQATTSPSSLSAAGEKVERMKKGLVESGGRHEAARTGTVLADSRMIPVDDEGNVHAKSFRSLSSDLTGNVPVSEPVEVGDVLVVDRLNPGKMKLADTASDPAVVGIVAGDPGLILGSSSGKAETTDEMLSQTSEGSLVSVTKSQADQNQQERQMPGSVEQIKATVALSGIVLCKVDASYGAIGIGDLLTTSATKGHAMRSSDHAPGTIIGKALESLEAGTGMIKVLVMMR